jgi:hypothetical protein
MSILLGGPRVFFNEGGHDGAASGNGYLDIGHLPNKEFLQEVEKLEYDQLLSNGERGTVLSKIIKKKLGASFTFDDFNAENVNLILSGDGPTSNVQAGGAITDEVAAAPVVLDRSIFTSETDISALSIDGVGGTPTYVLGTDYELVDAVTGEIKILSTGSITSGLALELNYTSAAKTTKLVKPGQDSLKQGSARIYVKTVGSSLNGLAWRWIIHNCTLSADGGIPIDPTAVSQAKLALDILADKVVDPANPYGKVLIG